MDSTILEHPITIGTPVEWNLRLFGRKTGVVILVVPAGSTWRKAIRGLGLTYTELTAKYSIGYMGTGPVRDHESFIVVADIQKGETIRRLYWPATKTLLSRNITENVN